jgi:hypothetical protein
MFETNGALTDGGWLDYTDGGWLDNTDGGRCPAIMSIA